MPVPPKQIHGLTRRQFVRTATGGLGLLLAPGMARGLMTATSGQRVRPSPNVLVLIQLAGGNDGLNTVIPLQDEAYRLLRPTLALAPEQSLCLDEHHGLHPACAGLHELYRQGKMALLPQVGAALPACGHFAAEEFWARGQSQPADDTGWLGRWLDYRHVADVCDGKPTAVFFGNHMPKALRSRHQHHLSKIHAADILAHRLGSQPDNTRNRYPAGLFGRSLGMLVDLMVEHPATQIYCLTLGGFDTHRDQAGQHAKLLQTLSTGMLAYQHELESRQLADHVVTMVWSEFGRQPHENDSSGTDHGSSGPVLLLGSRVNGGIVGHKMTATPEPSAAIDFHRIYATLLENWLASPVDAVLDRPWAMLPLLQNTAAYLPMP